MSDKVSIAKEKLKLKIYTRLYLYIKYKLELKKNKDIPSESKEELKKSILQEYYEEQEYNLSNANSTDNWLLNSLFNYECNETTMSDNCKLYLDHYLKPKLYTSKSLEKRKELLISFIEEIIKYLRINIKSNNLSGGGGDITIKVLYDIIKIIKKIKNENIDDNIDKIIEKINEIEHDNISRIIKPALLETLKPGSTQSKIQELETEIKTKIEKNKSASYEDTEDLNRQLESNLREEVATKIAALQRGKNVRKAVAAEAEVERAPITPGSREWAEAVRAEGDRQREEEQLAQLEASMAA